MNQAKFQQILNWLHPRNLKALQSFLGFPSFYCRFIKNYSKKISSLTSFLKKSSCFPLNEEALSQFHQLKEAFTTAPILLYPPLWRPMHLIMPWVLYSVSPTKRGFHHHSNPSLPTIVETNASDYALGAVLSQLCDSGKHPIAFDSHKRIPE
ncbi:hypothetical protein O181_076166 [Austropuccinia psidii MF-1]|uniref:Reverse transcriptase/retrotransposon-derived protein RNase H-like domain-containing protein n=1 Tax=Austropuccinia psidii MF-1 TaxID=1389203 RepID=A0A9Q3FFS0_9BASI|nr:hypothetical protein [Austropuccinia psidii MF-1]